MKLYDSVNEIISKVHEKSGKAVELIPVSPMATMAEVKIARRHNSSHRIFYNAESPEEINHLIGCKCVQIIRTFRDSLMSA